ncbi:hypothetical protein SCI86_RS25775, partial [Escherichia coli]
VSVVTLVWGISPRQPSGKNIIRWLLKKRTNGSVRYCQYTSHSHVKSSPYSLSPEERKCHRKTGPAEQQPATSDFQTR